MYTQLVKNSEEGKAQKHNQGKHQVTSQLIGQIMNQLNFYSQKLYKDTKTFQKEKNNKLMLSCAKLRAASLLSLLLLVNSELCKCEKQSSSSEVHK